MKVMRVLIVAALIALSGCGQGGSPSAQGDGGCQASYPASSQGKVSAQTLRKMRMAMREIRNATSFSYVEHFFVERQPALTFGATREPSAQFDRLLTELSQEGVGVKWVCVQFSKSELDREAQRIKEKFDWVSSAQAYPQGQVIEVTTVENHQPPETNIADSVGSSYPVRWVRESIAVPE